MTTPEHPTARAFMVLANNPSPMTLEGTNTWVLVEPGGDQAIVVDPGPDDARHRDAVMAAVEAAGAEQVALIVLTHGHADHCRGRARLSANAPPRRSAPWPQRTARKVSSHWKTASGWRSVACTSTSSQRRATPPTLPASSSTPTPRYLPATRFSAEAAPSLPDPTASSPPIWRPCID